MPPEERLLFRVGIEQAAEFLSEEASEMPGGRASEVDFLGSQEGSWGGGWQRMEAAGAGRTG